MNLDPLSPAEILGLTLIGEARGEPIEGIVAVGCVIRNRLHNNPSKYQSYRDVCLEPKQFSCWNENDPNYPFLLELANKMVTGQVLSDAYIRQCLWVATGIIDWSLVDNTKGSNNYMTKILFWSPKRPTWASSMKIAEEHGKQVFLRV